MRGRAGVPELLPCAELAFLQSTLHRVAPELEVSTCSAEDLVVFKAFAGRTRDWLDIEGIVTRQGARLDTTLIWSELLPLLELKTPGARRAIV